MVERNRRVDRLAWFAAIVYLFVATVFVLNRGARLAVSVQAATRRAPAALEVHYSPAEDLETLDLAELDTATKTIDISTYAMDDKPIADELVKLAGRGVKIRIYRDKTQYAGEVAHGKKKGVNLNLLFAGQPNIEERVKGETVLAHLKAYVVDGSVLREGSANWSVSGERQQDNSLILIRDQAAAAKFESNFEVIWARPDNQPAD